MDTTVPPGIIFGDTEEQRDDIVASSLVTRDGTRLVPPLLISTVIGRYLIVGWWSGIKVEVLVAGDGGGGRRGGSAAPSMTSPPDGIASMQTTGGDARRWKREATLIGEAANGDGGNGRDKSHGDTWPGQRLD
jgi:hypothetical protein